MEALALRQQDALRVELDERLGVVSARLQEMARKETSRERLRQELTLQVRAAVHPTPTLAGRAPGPPGQLCPQLPPRNGYFAVVAVSFSAALLLRPALDPTARSRMERVRRA